MKILSWKIFLIVLITLLVSTCAAKYGPMTSTGGYKEDKLAEDLYTVTFRGNQHNSLEEIRVYLAFRCAELTLANGFTHYIIEEDASYMETNSQFHSEDFKFDVSSSMSGGVNARAHSTMGPQESIFAINGIFKIRLLDGPDPVHKAASVDAEAFIEANRMLIKR